MPSMVPSFKLMCVTRALPAIESGSVAKPWFWAVIETRPVSTFFTGWLPPRCPNLSLKVVPPRAWVIIWWPRQIPNIG